MILIVTYDLKSPTDYHDFYETLKSQADSGKWWHYMSSTWLLSTAKSPQQIVDAIHPLMQPQDFLFVGELSPNYQGWLPKEAWDWINAELKPGNRLASISGGAPAVPSAPDALGTILGGLPKVEPPPDLKLPPVSAFPTPKNPWG